MLTFVCEGFPEFARCFNHSHLWKLQHSCMKFLLHIMQRLTAGCSAIELLRNTRSALPESFAESAEDFYNRPLCERQAEPVRGAGLDLMFG